VQVRLDRALRGRLDEAAEREQATPSEIVRRALDAYLS
jgi:predicted transcriptional regulator